MERGPVLDLLNREGCNVTVLQQPEDCSQGIVMNQWSLSVLQQRAQRLHVASKGYLLSSMGMTSTASI